MTMSLTGHASQATQIEQARAVGEVAAAIRYAQDNPRDEDRALALFERSCRRSDFAQRAFFRYRRGGQQVTGVTVAFAQEAARCWQNMSSGTSELSRRSRESEMVAFAWDLEMNTQRRTTFVNPHTGYTDTPKDDKPARELVAVRDIRENNQSAGSRVEREMILAVLPTWYVENGKRWCLETMANQGGDKPIEDRRRELIKTFEGIGVRREELIAKLGVAVDKWIEADLATLIVIGQSIKNGESTVESEFRWAGDTGPATATVNAAALTGTTSAPPARTRKAAAKEREQPAESAPEQQPDEPAVEPEPATAPAESDSADRMTGPQQRKLFACIRDAEIENRNEWATGLLGREITSFGQLTVADAAFLIDRLEEGLAALAGEAEQEAADDAAAAES